MSGTAIRSRYAKAGTNVVEQVMGGAELDPTRVLKRLQVSTLLRHVRYPPMPCLICSSAMPDMLLCRVR